MDQLTGESQIVSRAMMATTTLETPNELFWDGFYAACERLPLAAMPTTYHEVGWWAAVESRKDAELEDLIEAREDEEWHSRGGW